MSDHSERDTDAPSAPPLRNPARRTLLFSAAKAGFSGALAAGLGASAHAATPAGAPSAATQDFLKLSCFLTGRSQLSPVLAQRIHEQLSELDGGFADKVAALEAAIKAAGSADMEAYLKTPPAPAQRATMTTIVSAWYLGYTGRPNPGAQTDNAKFVTYTDALMFEPTRDATVIPSYARDKTNYWADPPASIETD